MKLVVATNDEKRSAHLERIVTQTRRDQQRGDTFLPPLMVDKLHALHRVFRKQITQLGQANGRKIVAVQRRNETTRELCYLVRDVYVMAKRKYERGKLTDDALAAHVIPKEPVRDNERKTASWVVRAEHLLLGDLTHRKNNPTILRDPTREELQTAMEAADGAHQEAIDAVDHLGKMQTRMQELRKELDQLLIKARHALVGAFFQLEGPGLRDVLHAYGYHYRGKRRQKAEPQIEIPSPESKQPTRQPETNQPSPTPEATQPTPESQAKQPTRELETKQPSPTREAKQPTPPEPQAKQTPSMPEATQPVAPHQPESRTPQDPLPTATSNEPLEAQRPSNVDVGKLPADFRELITIEEKPKAPPKVKGTNRKPTSASEKEKKKARRKQARQSRKQNR